MTNSHRQTTTSPSNEPSSELQKLANRFAREYRSRRSRGDDVLSAWCDHLKKHTPEILDLPVMQLVKAIALAKTRHLNSPQSAQLQQ